MNKGSSHIKPFFAFIRKEFYHIWRDKQTLLILFGMPIVQIIIFGFALTNEVKNSRIAVLDPSKDAATQQITARLEASQYFDIQEELVTGGSIDRAFKEGKIKMALVFPLNFRNTLVQTGHADLQIITDASDPNIASTVANYASAIIQDYQKEQWGLNKVPYRINTTMRMLYNPQLKGAYNFVPGVMAMILLLVCTMMTSIAIVREKERGTMEILLASPLKALADYVYAHRCDWNSARPVVESLRVDERSLAGVDLPSFDRLLANHTARRVRRFLECLRKDLIR